MSGSALSLPFEPASAATPKLHTVVCPVPVMTSCISKD
jgi:hypothetical protein